MHNEYFFIKDSRNWHAIEAISESLPQTDVISSFALIIETEDPRHISALMVASQKKKVFRILYLIGQ